MNCKLQTDLTDKVKRGKDNSYATGIGLQRGTGLTISLILHIGLRCKTAPE